ncbi:alpha/beta hydrolase family protein [Adhaeribacter aquaticus]|uniref:alpha/beta hydrolase family protein n=1 Tax=Adhaeribacter aquaticus TaxID=299567 RepID=UPI00047C25D0|nr:alpha/beta hydrolase [Adhaeribacter aquaticus]
MKKTTLFVLALLVVSSIVGAILWNSRALNQRPQEPSKPFSYHNEEVRFQNAKANITLAGTLTLPSKAGNYPAVILITGSGAQNRDAEFFGHKPFLVISDYLTKHGIAVLRYDDRGFGQSSGDFISATPLDFASDVESAISYLKTRKEINKNKIGLIGHSEGGIVAPIVASNSKDVSFIVLLAGLGIQGKKALLQQSELTLKTSGASESEIQNTKEINAGIAEIFAKHQTTEVLKADLNEFIQKNIKEIPTYIKPTGITKEEFIAKQIEFISLPAYQFIWNYEPALTLEKVSCPVLALNGEKDLQVLPKENLEAINNALKNGNNKNVTIKVLPNLNHFFQESKTGSPYEYATIEQTFSPTALGEILNWVSEQVE